MAKYSDLIEHTDDPRGVRYRMVLYAIDFSDTAAATRYGTSPQLVRLWRNRFEEFGYEGLAVLSGSGQPQASRSPEEQKIRVKDKSPLSEAGSRGKKPTKRIDPESGEVGRPVSSAPTKPSQRPEKSESAKGLVKYGELIAKSENPAQVRHQIVLHAIEHGNQAAARRFGTSDRNVTLWRSRFEREGYAGLEDLSWSRKRQRYMEEFKKLEKSVNYSELDPYAEESQMIRYQMVQMAIKSNDCFAAERFGTSSALVGRWRHRFEELGYEGLISRPAGSHTHPGPLTDEERQMILEAKRKAPNEGANKLKAHFELPMSIACIKKVLSKAGLSNKYRRQPKP